ncbi:MAG: hypothetical protein MZU95_14860 [Desulfomicrobium escambiense]|nr:hypothetical protein [Desulfomicrobium escambiense]
MTTASLGRRNDYEIAKIEEKMGIHGSATCLINFGDNNDCYAELLGNEREGMKVMFQMMNEAQACRRPAGPLQRLHRLSACAPVYQGAGSRDHPSWRCKNPEAPRVPIIQHPDVQADALVDEVQRGRHAGLIYFTAYCFDMA